MFKCKLCPEHVKTISELQTRLAHSSPLELVEEMRARIDDLKLQIEDLKMLSIPRRTPHHVSVLQVEADAALSGNQDQIPLSDEQMKELEELEAVSSEASRLLSGNY